MPSPPKLKSAPRGDGRADPRLLLALLIGAVAIVVTWQLRRGARDANGDTAGEASAAPTARLDAVPPPAAPAPEPTLAERIERALIAAGGTATATLPLLDPFGAPLDALAVALGSSASSATGVPDDAVRWQCTSAGLTITARQDRPAIELLLLSPLEQAPRLLRRLPLAGGDVRLDPIRFAPGATLRGRLFGPDEAPLAGRTVTLWDPNATELDRATGRTLPLATTSTDRDGNFTFAHCHARVLRCEASGSDGLANAVLPEAVAGERPVRIDARAADVALRGTIVAPGGAPLEGVAVVATMTGPSERASQRVRSDATGCFTLDGLPRGYYVLSAEAPDRVPVTLRRAHTGTAGIVLVLEPTATAALELIGAPARLDIPLWWRPLDGVDPRRRPTGPFSRALLRDGQLTITGLLPGRHALELRVPGAAPITTHALDYDAGRTTQVGSYQLAIGATLTARLVDATGAPLAGRAALAAPFQAEHVVRRDVFDLTDRDEQAIGSDGLLRWEALPAGMRTIAFRSAGCADHARAVELPSSGTIDLGTIALTGAGSIEGVVRRLSGVPLGDATVQAERVGGPQLDAITSADGRYRFDHLPPGRFEVRLLPADDESLFVLGDALNAGDPPSIRLDLAAGAVVQRDLELDR